MTILAYSHAVSVAPASEPVTAAEVKRHIDLDSSISFYDDDITRWIQDSRERVERDCRRALIDQTHVLKLDAFPDSDYIECLQPPLSSVTSVTYIDTGGTSQTFASSKYTVDADRTPGAVLLGYNESWPSTRGQRNAVTVTYVAGYGSSATDVPPAARDAILMLVKHRYEHPELAGESLVEVPNGYNALIGSLIWGDYP